MKLLVYICNLVRERAKHGYLTTCKVRWEDCEFKANLGDIETLNPWDIVRLSSSETNPWQSHSSFGHKVLRGVRLQCWMCPWWAGPSQQGWKPQLNDPCFPGKFTATLTENYSYGDFFKISKMQVKLREIRVRWTIYSVCDLRSWGLNLWNPLSGSC